MSAMSALHILRQVSRTVANTAAFREQSRLLRFQSTAGIARGGGGGSNLAVPRLLSDANAHRAQPQQKGLSSSSGPGFSGFAKCPKDERVIRDLFLSFAHHGGRGDSDEEDDGPPCLNVDDLRDLLVAIGEHPSEDRLGRLIDEIDADRSGTVEYDEFLEGCDAILGHHSADDDGECGDGGLVDLGVMVDTFRTLDRDGNGVLTLDELEGLISTTGGKIGEEDARSIMKAADADGSGSIDLSEFLNLVSNPSLGRLSWRLRSGFRAFLVLGGPGSGKGTLCDRMVDRAGIRHCSSGDVLREELESGSPLAREIGAMMKAGGLVPSTTIIALLKKRLGRYPGALLALDGFPRSVENYRDFDDVCGRPEFALLVDVPDEVMIERILKRAETSGRADDNLDTAMKRLDTFHKLTKPTLSQLERDSVPVYKLDGRGSPEDIWDELLDTCPPVRQRAQYNLRPDYQVDKK